MLLVKTQDLVKYLLLQMQELTPEATLACFGSYYFEDVLGNPNGTDHQNIRNFMKTAGMGSLLRKCFSVEIKYKFSFRSSAVETDQLV
jgi:hypothetical protein